SEWDPAHSRFSALTSIFGTLVTSLIAMIIAVPVSFGIALFITELAPAWLRRPVSTAIELLAAIPSIIYGMWGLFVFAPLFGEYVQPWITTHIGNWPLVGILFRGPPMGIGMFTAGLILAIMVIPFISSVMRDVFDLVPTVLKESAYGVGCTTWEVVWNVVLPYTRVGVVGGVMLGLGRALGETMAVTFVIGNSHTISSSLFMPGNTISSTLANEFSEAVGQTYTSSLIALGLILFLITFVVLALAKLLLLRMAAREGSKS
ncbi:MAG: phosphate ABC transporter permease subunit PstC, partial [Gammaproteobacteria bacterium]